MPGKGGKRCIAGYCSNTNKDGVSLFTFPKDHQVAAQWTRKVQTTRADFKRPSKHSALCSRHFDDSCFEPRPIAMAELGFEVKRRLILKPGSVPTIFPRPSQEDNQQQKTVRGAYAKREHKRVMEQINLDYAATSTSTRDTSTSINVGCEDSEPEVVEMDCEPSDLQSPGRRSRKKLCFDSCTVNTSFPEIEDSGTDVNASEVDIQCPHMADHNYCSTLTKDSATQTDPAPSLSAFDLDSKYSKFYTGIDIDSFWKLLHALVAFLPQPGTVRLAVPEQLLLVLMRLRLGLMFTDLGKRFGISRSTACDVFSLWRSVLAKFMRENVIAWLPRAALKRIRSQSFSWHCSQTTCIIARTEILVQKPQDPRQQSQTYKRHNTYKVLYGLAPNGYVMFVSKLFGKKASDAFVTQNSGLVDHLTPGDQILADRGLIVTDVLPPGVTLKGTETLRLSNIRINVERAVRRLKGFKILSNVIPGSIKHVYDIVSICAGLCNLQPLFIWDEMEEVEASGMDEGGDWDDPKGDEYLWDVAEDIEKNY
ncbi:uncharacterized protein KZ484_000758 isoform 2-T2 [Pholidichthys leucotaenia]